MEKVKVSKFENWIGNQGGFILSENYATLEKIAELGKDARIIENTTIEVDASKVDGHGIYRP
jgi:hypothetical protein